MAYGTRWEIQGTQHGTDHAVRAYIKERDYSGSSTVLDGGQIPIDVFYTPTGFYGDTEHPVIAGSSCTIQFYEDNTEQLAAIRDGDDEQFQIVININSVDLWTGFVINETYTSPLYGNGIATLSASDRISTLGSIRFASELSSSPFTDTVSLVTTIYRALLQTGLDLGFETAFYWYPYLTSNALDTTYDPLARIKANQIVFRDDDLNPYSSLYVLEQILGKMQCRLFQFNNRWHIEQRRKNVYDSSGTDVYKVFRYTSAGAADSPTTAEITARANVGFDETTVNQFIGAQSSGSIPYGQVSTIYYHGAEDNIVGNPSFESAILANGSGADGNWEPNAAASLDASNGGSGSDGALALRMDAEYLTSAATTFPDDVISTRRVDQTTGQNIAGGSGIKLSFSVDWAWDSSGGGFGWGDIYTYMRVQVGSYWLYKDTTDGLFKWTTTPTGNQHYILPDGAGTQLAPGYNTFTFLTEDLYTGSSAISGELYIELYGVVEDYNGTATAIASYGRWDNIQVSLIGADGTVFNEATRTTITVDGTANAYEPEIPYFLIGDGPTSEHDGALVVTDSSDTDVATNLWSYLPAAASPNTSLDELWANQLYREFRDSRRLVSSAVYTTDTTAPPTPLQHLVIENPNSTATHDYIWRDLHWRPLNHDQVLSGTWCQFRMSGNGDSKCSADIKPDSFSARGIPLQEGLPCEVLEDFNPAEALEGVWFNAEDVSGTAAPDNGIYTFTAPGDVTSYPWITNSTPWTDSLIHSATGDVMNQIKADKDEGYIFFRRTSNRYLHRADLDGSNVVSSTIRADQLAIDRTNKEIIVYNTTSIVRYDYDLSFVASLYAREGTDIGGIACDQSGNYIIFQELANDGDDDVIKLDLSDSSEELLTTFTALTQANSVFNNRTVIDEAEDIVFLRIDNNPGNIYSIDFSAPSSLNLVVSNVGLGLALDRVNQKIIYDDKDGNLKWCDYDGTNVETIYNGPSSLEISAIDAGMS